MLIYKNKGKEIKINGNEIKNIDINLKNIIGKPFIPIQYVSSFSSPKIKVKSVIEILINNIIVDEYEKDFVIGNDMLGYYDELKDISDNDLLVLTRNVFENEKDFLIDVILKNRIK